MIKQIRKKIVNADDNLYNFKYIR